MPAAVRLRACQAASEGSGSGEGPLSPPSGRTGACPEGLYRVVGEQRKCARENDQAGAANVRGMLSSAVRPFGSASWAPKGGRPAWSRGADVCGTRGCAAGAGDCFLFGEAETTHSELGPVVHHTGKSPTGYTVTFRYRDPTAKIVQIEGEWYFSSPESTSVESSEGRSASQWEQGDIAINPDAPQDILAGLKSTWPDAAMTKDAGGVWSYTTPLPSGVYSYGFVVNCTHSDLTPAQQANPETPSTYTGCPEIADPSNPPWNEHKGVTHGSTVTYSQIYVPSDPAFHTNDYS